MNAIVIETETEQVPFEDWLNVEMADALVFVGAYDSFDVAIKSDRSDLIRECYDHESEIRG